jgi:hypothetical protein
MDPLRLKLFVALIVSVMTELSWRGRSRRATTRPNWPNWLTVKKWHTAVIKWRRPGGFKRSTAIFKRFDLECSSDTRGTCRRLKPIARGWQRGDEMLRRRLKLFDL